MSEEAISGFYAYTQTLKGVYYGPGSVKNSLTSVLEGLNTKKVLIVTGKSLREKVGRFFFSQTEGYLIQSRLT